MTTTQSSPDPFAPGSLVDDLTVKKKKDKSAPFLEVNENAAKAAIDSFAALDLDDGVVKALGAIGWSDPTPVQKLCLPFTTTGRHVAGFAQTGTGKTGVFLITIANHLLRNPREEGNNNPRAVVLAPTRELAMQIDQDAGPMLSPCGLKSIAVFGGIDYDKQARTLKDGVDVIVATPGRLKDYVKKKVVDLSSLSVFVCDEADRMFDMGFIEDVEYFLDKIPEESQKLLFSATTNEEVKELAFEYLENPEYISVNPEVLTPEKIDQKAIHVNANNKLKVLLGLMRDHSPECAIIFTNTKLSAEWLHYKLEHNGIEADLITGDLPQKKRIRLIHKIKEGKIKALVATDVASRGLHISRVTHVYNFDLPEEPANYVHRIGRTARAGAKGAAYSLVCDDYGHNMADINEMLGEDVAVPSEWFDERYLEIEDKAGNPFDDPESGPSRSRERARGDRDGRSGRGDRDGRSGRGDRKEGRGDRKEGRGGKGSGPRRERDDRAQSARGGAGRRQGASGDAPKKRKRRRRGKGGEDRPQAAQGRGRQKPQGQSPKSAQPEAKAPTGVGGLLKKVMRTLFGRK